MQRSGFKSQARKYDDDANGKAKASRAGSITQFSCLLFVLGALSVIVPVLLGSAVPKNRAEYVQNVKNALRSFTIRRPDTPPVDTEAARLLFSTYSSSAKSLQAKEIADGLLAAVLLQPPTAGSEVPVGPMPAAHATEEAVIPFLSAIQPVVETMLDSSDTSALGQDPSALYLLALCTHWEGVPADMRGERLTEGRRIADHLLARTTPDGLYDIRSASSIEATSLSSTPVLAVRTLRQVQAMAGLRCLGKLLDAQNRVIVGKHAPQTKGGRRHRLQAIREHNSAVRRAAQAAGISLADDEEGEGAPGSQQNKARRAPLQEIRRNDALNAKKAAEEEARAPPRPAAAGRKSVLQEMRARKGRALLQVGVGGGDTGTGGGNILTSLVTAGASYYAGAERLRRGLSQLVPDAGEEGAPALYWGLTYSSPGSGLTPQEGEEEDKGVPVEKPGELDLERLAPVSTLTSELAQTLLYLEPGDIPDDLLQSIAESSVALTTPVGIRMESGGAAGAGDAWETDTAAWRVAPGEQAVIVQGALKHLLALDDHASREQAEEGGTGADKVPGEAELKHGLEEKEWATADALAALMDRALRIAPALAAVQKEAAGRNDERMRRASSRVDSLLHTKQLGGGKRQVEAAEDEHTVSMLSSAHRFPFATTFIPVGPTETAVDPRSAPPMLPLWSWIRGSSGLTGTLFRLQYVATMVMGGAKVDIKEGVHKEAVDSPTSLGKDAGRALAQELLSSLAYPVHGLQVVRLPGQPEGGQGMTQGQRREQEGMKKAAEENLAALGLTSGRSLGVEQVVVQVPAHAHDAAPGAQADVHGEAEEVTGTLSVRGDGHPVALPTVVAAQLLRVLYESAYTWHKSRAQRGRSGASPSPPALNPHPVPPTGEQGDRKKVLIEKGKAALRAVGHQLQAVKLQSVLFPFKRRGAAAGPAPSISNGALLSFLTSGTQQAEALVQRLYWGDAEREEAWREKCTSADGCPGLHSGGDGASDAGAAAQPVSRPVPVPQAEGPGGRSAAAAEPNNLPALDGGAAPAVSGADRTGVGDVLSDSPAEWLEGEGGQEAEGGAGEGETSTLPVLVDAAALHSRICERASKYWFAAGGQPAWYASCCESDGGKAMQHAQELVQEGDLPKFLCKSNPESDKYAAFPCSYVEDNLCDCGADGLDENSTSACGAAGGAFKCESGVKTVKDGALAKAGADAEELPQGKAAQQLPRGALARYGYIAADKVGDGVEDCVDGEDESG